MMATDVFSIEDFKKEFTEIKSILEHWDRIENLLRHKIFRQSLIDCNEKDDTRIRDIGVENLCNKLVVGALGFLWCKGTKEEKAEFLFDLCSIPTIRKK